MRVVCSGAGVVFPGLDRSVEALREVSFHAESGEFLAIVGPSGCGKTTLLRMLAGLIPPHCGTVERFESARNKSQVLLLFQENNLFPWMTVLENAEFGLEMRGVERSERRARARELLERMGLGGWERSYPRQLSVGMRQRVAIVRCFLTDPGLLLMDEPFSAMDYQTRQVLHQELLDLWEQNHKTVIFVTHDVEEAILLSDRILVMRARPGNMIAEFPVPLRRPRTAATALDDEVLVLRRKIHRVLEIGSAEPDFCPVGEEKL